MTFSKYLFVSCILTTTTLAGTALAQRTAADLESARQAYNDGIALRDKGDTKGALEKFKAAHALGNTPITGIELCKTYAAIHQPVEAREVCLGVARIPPIPGETQHSQDARAEAGRVAEEVKPQIATIRVRITGVPEGREPTVMFDGVAVPVAGLTEPRSVDPGTHTITAKVGTGVETKAVLDAREGEAKSIELTVQPPPVDEPPPPPPPGPKTPEKKKSSLGTVGFAIAGIGAGIGVIAGVVALSDKGDLTDKCTNHICGRDEWDALDHAKTWGTVSTVMFVVAGVGLAVGIYGTLASPKSTTATTPAPKRASIEPMLGLGGGGVHGTF